ncbi:hypothetical protein AQJ11_02850 [Streptomyces corchorusii]|uniref:Uncharacterized protein n=2 Tax=Streptomyces TaxID=1883 RepID=A0A101QM49_STRCK|nr:hypothetical protein [Streptomyces corchorusii]KUN32480.1 hypothetical protein AQJ11_02850 [Streptomyces corchorusii]
MTDQPDKPAAKPATRTLLAHALQQDRQRQASGVRVEYRARVPRHLLAAALAEAFAVIERETQQQDTPPTLD